jgi:hypothetical protein
MQLTGIQFWLWALILAVSMEFCYAAPLQTQCLKNETVYFNCTLRPSGKVASLCGKDDGTTVPYLQYRFGKIGKPLDLVVPKKSEDLMVRDTFFFTSGKNRYDDLVTVQVWFRNQDTYYSLDSLTDLSHVEIQTDHQAEISYWKTGSKPSDGGLLNCAEENAGENLQSAESLIEKMASPGRQWNATPWDIK